MANPVVSTTYQNTTPSSTPAGIQQSRTKVRLTAEDQARLIEPSYSSGQNILQQAKVYKEAYGDDPKYEKLTATLDEFIDKLEPALNNLGNVLELGSGNALEIAEALNDARNYSPSLEKVLSLFKQVTEENRKNYKQELKNIKSISEAKVKLNKKEIKEFEKELLNANKNLASAWGKSIHGFAKNITDVIAKLDVSKMAQSLQPSTKTLLQRGFQLDYGINKSEFNKFKHDLFNSVDTSLYSSEQILASFDTFKNSYMKSSAITKQLQSDVIYGLNQLELSSSAQSSMLKQSNATGRNQLAFYQDNFAKYITSDLGIQRSQLNELVSMNQQLVDNAAALGIDSAVSNQTLLNEQAALNKFGLSGTYASSLNSMISNLTAPAVLLGMTSEQLSDYLSGGGSYYDLLTKGKSPAMQYLRNAYNTNNWNTAKTVAQQAYGLDDATMELLRQAFKQGGTIDQSLAEVRDATTKSAAEAKKETENNTKSTTNIFSQTFTALDNWFTDFMDWPFEDTMVGIFKVTTYIAELLTAQSTADIFKGGKSLLSKLGNSKLGTALGGVSIGNASGLAAIGGAGLVAGGTLWGISDATKMQGSTGAGVIADSARGFFLGTGSKQKSTNENIQSGLSNAAKYALIGAGVGTFFGPGLGTAIGAGIGGAVGGLMSLLGSNMADQRALQEEQLEQQKAINRNTQDTAHQVGLVTHYRDSAYIAAGGDVSGYGTGVTYTHANKNIGGHKITSWYGKRGEIRNKKTNEVVAKAGFHSGIDVGMNAGTSLGAPYAGTVVFNGWRNRGGHNIDIMDANGYVHTFMHLQSKPDFRTGDIVSAGQFIGNAGASGGNYSPHLHYSVSKGSYSHKNTVDPYDFLMSSSIFGGTGSAIPTVSNSDSVSDSLTSGSVNQTASLYTIGVGGDVGSSISSPIVSSIVDLRDTLVALNEKVSSQEKLMNLLTSQKTSPTI